MSRAHLHKRNVELLTAPWPAADSRQQQNSLVGVAGNHRQLGFTTMGVWVHVVAKGSAWTAIVQSSRSGWGE
jgi:hypothetical protein